MDESLFLKNMSLVFCELKSLPTEKCWKKCILRMFGTYRAFSSHQGTLPVPRFVESTKQRKQLILFIVSINVAFKGIVPDDQEQGGISRGAPSPSDWSLEPLSPVSLTRVADDSLLTVLGKLFLLLRLLHFVQTSQYNFSLEGKGSAAC